MSKMCATHGESLEFAPGAHESVANGAQQRMRVDKY
jgi:hypothetical protein